MRLPQHPHHTQTLLPETANVFTSAMEEHALNTAMQLFFEDTGLHISYVLPGSHRSHITT